MVIELYLLLGPEEGLKAEFIKKTITERYQGQELDQRRFYAASDTMLDLVDFLRTPSLFALLPVAELHNLTTLKSQDLKQLIRYCQNPEGKGMLFICSSALKVEQGLAACIKKKQQKIFWEMFDNNKVPWVKQYCRQHGYNISVAASQQLLALVENEVGELAASCELVMLYAADNHELDSELVEEALIHSKRESLFSLFDGLMTGTLEQVLEISQILASRGEEAASLMPGLESQFSKLIDIKCWSLKNRPWEDIFKELRVLGKHAQKSFRLGCQRYSLAKLEQLLQLLTDYDFDGRQRYGSINQIKFNYFLYQCLIREERGQYD